MSEYQGHPSWHHWNVALLVNNEEPLYRLAQKTKDGLSFFEQLKDIQFKLEDGSQITEALAVYAWKTVHDIPSATNEEGYPLYYITKDGGILCPKCAQEHDHLSNDPDDPQWFIIGYEVNWEDPELLCDHGGERIPSAYAEDEVG